MAAPSETAALPSRAARDGAADRAVVPWRRVGSFTGLPLISLVGQLSLIPVIASVGGAQGWAAVALGQALGGGAATIMQYGWGFTGPTRLAPLPQHDRGRLLWVSILSRLIVAAVLLPLTAAVAAALAPQGHRLLAGLTSVALAMMGMSALWFFVGTGRPGQAARYETLPRLLTLLLAALVVLVTQDAIWYPVLFLAGQLVATTWLVSRLGVVSLGRRTWAEAFGALRSHRTAAATDVLFAIGQAVPTGILAAVAPGALATFAAGDRVQRLGQSGVQPLFNAFQGWVCEATGNGAAARMRLAVATTGACGLAGATGFAVGLPLVDHLLFAGEVTVGYGVSVFFGLSLALYALTSSINFTVLAPAGLTGDIFRSTAVGGLVVVLAISTLPHHFGAAGGAASVAAAQAAALAVQFPAWRRAAGRGSTPVADRAGRAPQGSPQRSENGS
jgi:O-antigen/teichoic acid export membrane protein